MYIVSEEAFPAGPFLRPNVLCFCLDEDAVLLEGKPVPGPILGNSFITKSLHYEKRAGAIVIVQMLAGTWYRLFDIDPASFTTILALDDAHCPGLEALLHDLRAAQGDLDAIQGLLDAFLLTRLKTAHPRGLAERFRAELLEDLGQTVSDIAARLGVSERTLQRNVRKTFGVTPDHLRRINRLYRSLNQGRGLDIQWLDVSIDLAFVDQSHWIKEFRKLQGITPGEYRQLPIADWRYYRRGPQDRTDPATYSPKPCAQWEEHFNAADPAFDLNLAS